MLSVRTVYVLSSLHLAPLHLWLVAFQKQCHAVARAQCSEDQTWTLGKARGTEDIRYPLVSASDYRGCLQSERHFLHEPASAKFCVGLHLFLRNERPGKTIENRINTCR